VLGPGECEMKKPTIDINVEHRNGKVILSERDWKKVIRYLQYNPANDDQQRDVSPISSTSERTKIAILITAFIVVFAIMATIR
jgi:hypothetical protein